MGGGGSMAMANNSLKYNKSLIGKRKFKDVKKMIFEQSGKTELEFKQISHLELSQIKREIRLKAKQRAKRNSILLLTITIILIIVLAYLLGFIG